jgi:HlyD family secretion protein
LREVPLKLRGWLILLLLVGAAVAAWMLINFKNDPPEVKFEKAARETIHSSVTTNGKVEPIEWAAARTERAGPVVKFMVDRGRHVSKDEPLLELDSSEATAALSSAHARIAGAKAELRVIEQGGRSTDLAEISSEMARAKLDLKVAEDEYEKTKRLVAKQAAARMEETAAKRKIDEVQLHIQALDQRKAALAVSSDRAPVQARLDDAEAAAHLAEIQIKQSIVRAPIDGTVYQFDLKPGAYLNAGDTVASIGRLDRVRVNVYVDEPDLGHVAVGMPVIITWDALAGRDWTGVVDKTPTQIVAQGTRQVGEVACVIQNPNRDLLPGTNVTVEIRSATVASTVTIPKEAVRTVNSQTGVYLLNGAQLAWKPVKMGVANTTRVQVDGLNEGDAVALFSEKPLKDGMQVKAVFP